MKHFYDKIKSAKLAMRCLREGSELLEAQDTEAKDFDGQWLIESKDLKWSFPMVARAIRHRQTKLVVYEPQKSEVFTGIQGDYIDRDYCEKNKIEVVPFPTQGGAAVMSKGDLMLIFVRPNKKGTFHFLDFVMPKIVEYITEHVKDSEASISGNDIEVNGKKLSGSSISHKMGSVTEGIFISGVNGKKNLDAIGHKKGKREVTSLKELGIDAKEFKKWLLGEVEKKVNHPKGD